MSAVQRRIGRADRALLDDARPTQKSYPFADARVVGTQGLRNPARGRRAILAEHDRDLRSRFRAENRRNRIARKPGLVVRADHAAVPGSKRAGNATTFQKSTCCW